MKPFLLEPSSSVVVCIDMQERLFPAIAGCEELLSITRRLLQAAALLEVPVITTEQYPRGLGHTLEELEIPHNPPHILLEKEHFSCGGSPEFLRHLEKLGRRQLVLCGIEAHICVLSTALDLLQRDFQVVIPEDGVSSRNLRHKEWGLRAAASAGAAVLPEESVVYQWLGKANTPLFKKVLPLYAGSPES